MRKEYVKPGLQEVNILERSCLLAGSGKTEIVNLKEDKGEFDTDENNYFVINAKAQNNSI